MKGKPLSRRKFNFKRKSDFFVSFGYMFMLKIAINLNTVKEKFHFEGTRSTAWKQRKICIVNGIPFCMLDSLEQ